MMNAPTPTARRALTASAALAAYHAAGDDPAQLANAAHLLAQVLQAKAAPKLKPPAKGYDLTAEGLSRALKAVSKATSPKSYAPILAHVLLKARGDVLTLTACDLDSELVATVPAPGVGTWEATADARQLAGFVSKASGPVEFRAELAAVTRQRDGRDVTVREGFLYVAAGAASVRLASLDPSDWPGFAGPDMGAASFALGASALGAMLRFVGPCVSAEETRYFLNGAYLHAFTDRGRTTLRTAATDGHRMAVIEFDLPAGAESLPGVILPRLSLPGLLAVIEADLVADAAVTVAPDRVRVEAGALRWTSKTIDSPFPDYMRCVPAGNDRRLEVDRADLRDAVARVAALSVEKSKSVRFTLAPGVLTLTVRNMEGGQVSEAFPVDYAGPETDTGFNARYLLDALAAFKGERVVLELPAEQSSPTKITAPDAPGRFLVLMSLRV